MWGRFGFDYRGGGGGGGASLDYVIRGGGGWVLITVDDGGGGGKNCQNIDYVICERPLLSYKRYNAARLVFMEICYLNLSCLTSKVLTIAVV